MWLGFSTLFTGEVITREGLWFIASWEGKGSKWEAEWLRSLMGEVAGRQVVGWKIGGSYHAMRQPPAQPSPAAPASKGHHSFPHPHPHPPILCLFSHSHPPTRDRALNDWTDCNVWHLTPAKAKPSNRACCVFCQVGTSTYLLQACISRYLLPGLQYASV